MKIAIALLAVVSVAYGGVIGAPYAVPAVGIVNTGASSQFRSQDNIGNYAFGYNEDHSTGGTFRRESGAPGVAVGSYGLRDIDGRVRVVNYVADGAGFRANIQTNEPGVEPRDPASVLINKAAAIVGPALAPAPLVAPAPLAAPLAAPIAPYAAGPIAAPYAAPYAVAPIAASSYSTSVAHVAPAPYAAAPLVAPIAAAPLAVPAYAAKTFAAPYAAPYYG